MHLAYRNVNEAMLELPSLVASEGNVEDTRNGRAYALDEPLILEITQPCERTHLLPERKANALLFLLDGLSILSQRDWVRPFSDIVPRFKNYSDDGVHLRGHYGKRLAHQIPFAVNMLQRDPLSRRNVLQIWDSKEDQDKASVDIPCNVTVNLRGRKASDGGSPFLDLSVFNRSNDVWWGMLGANIVQFSFLLEYLARCSNMRVGKMYQISTNAHVYLDFGPGDAGSNWTRMPQPTPTPLDTFLLRVGLDRLFDTLSYEGGWKNVSSDQFPGNVFLSNIVVPMIHAHYQNDPMMLSQHPNNDWFLSMRIGKGWTL